MQDPIQAALAEVDRRLATLNALRGHLAAVASPTPPAVQTSALPGGSRTDGRKVVRTVPTKLAAATKIKRGVPGGGFSALSENMIRLGRGLTEPFGMGELRDAGNLGAKEASNAITRWLLKKWITRVAFGRYNRTRTFGGEPAIDGNKMLQEIHKEIDTARDE